MHGITVPKTPKQALELDLVNNNHLWRDAIGKEIDTMREYNVFSPIHKGKTLLCSEGWQFSPLHWVFAVETDLRHKARMVMGGHVTNADDMDKYAATTSMNGVKLQLYLTSRGKKDLISGDVGSAYLNSFTQRKDLDSFGS